jgi:predicted ArsR family transcriptional regulator
MYSAVEPHRKDGREYRLLSEILAGLLVGRRSQERAAALAEQWGRYLVGRGAPRPGAPRSSRRSLAILQEAMAEAGFDPRFRRMDTGTVEVTMRDCPFRDLLDDHRDLVCAVHRGLLDGMFAAVVPPLRMESFQPLAERTTCRVVARS